MTQQVKHTYHEALESLRTASDAELAITLKLFSSIYECATGEPCAVAEAAAERLMAREGKAP